MSLSAMSEIGYPARLARATANPFRLLTSSAFWGASVFHVLSFPIGVFWFTALVTLISTSIGLAIVWVGVPLFIFTAFLWTYGARAERWRVNVLLGEAIPSPYLSVAEGTLWQRSRAFLTDPAVWRDLVYLFLLFPIGIFEFVYVVCAFSISLALATLPLYSWSLADGQRALMLNGVALNDPLPIGLATLAGIILVLLLPYPTVGIAYLHALLARALLGPTRDAQLSARVDTLSATRARAMEAILSDRRRLERDLHDGAQQRLTSLAMDLGMAKEKLNTDPVAARALVENAHSEAKRALAEIRDLARGIHPAVLTDRGLDAALSALAARCPLPVTVRVTLPSRLPEVIESTAYFVVAEALTNIAKHSGATEASVSVGLTEGLLRIVVEDNGVGGVNPAAGTGIAGLVDRLAAIDGRLDISGPLGGPTLLVAEAPCVL